MSKFFSPKQAIDAEVSAISANVNAALAAGNRVFSKIPTRILRAVGDAFTEANWTVSYTPDDDPNFGTIELVPAATPTLD